MNISLEILFAFQDQAQVQSILGFLIFMVIVGFVGSMTEKCKCFDASEDYVF